MSNELRDIIMDPKPETMSWKSKSIIGFFLVFSLMYLLHFENYFFAFFGAKPISFLYILIGYMILIDFSFKNDRYRLDIYYLNRKVENYKSETLLYKKWLNEKNNQENN